MTPAIAGDKFPTASDAGLLSENIVKSAGRALQVLEFFAEIRRDARAFEIAKAINLPQSSASMLLRSLVELGYLAYDPSSRTYTPTSRVMMLGSWMDGGAIRNGSLIRALEFMAERTSNAIFLAARNGIYSQYIYVIPGQTALRFHVPLGSRRLLVRSAAVI